MMRAEIRLPLMTKLPSAVLVEDLGPLTVALVLRKEDSALAMLVVSVTPLEALVPTMAALELTLVLLALLAAGKVFEVEFCSLLKSIAETPIMFCGVSKAI